VVVLESSLTDGFGDGFGVGVGVGLGLVVDELLELFEDALGDAFGDAFGVGVGVGVGVAFAGVASVFFKLVTCACNSATWLFNASRSEVISSKSVDVDALAKR
jgi:hypothetical protein